MTDDGRTTSAGAGKRRFQEARVVSAANSFADDGSFMQKFLEMQQRAKGSAAKTPPGPAASADGASPSLAPASVPTTSPAPNAAVASATGSAPGVVAYPSYNPRPAPVPVDLRAIGLAAKRKAEAQGLLKPGAGEAKKPRQAKSGYDSDEDTEGGTWEHKKRLKEMEKTREVMDKLTQQATGKHHVADFMPEEENRRFMEKVIAAREGRKIVHEDYANKRLTSDNKGFQMTAAGGWTAGKGLGSEGQGIKVPINRGEVRGNREGLGVAAPAEPAKEDDVFDLYRKRCMVAYRHRPNRLNNPRRGYDGYEGGVGSAAPKGNAAEKEEYDY